MDLKIISQKDEPLLSRKRVIAEVIYDNKTPSNAEVKKMISAEMKVSEELIVIEKIQTLYGKRSAKTIAYAYLNKEDMAKIVKVKVKKDKKEAPKEEKK